MTAGLTADHFKALAGVCHFGGRYVNTEQVYEIAYGNAWLPGKQSVANRLAAMRKLGFVEKRVEGMVRFWRITEAGRAAMRVKEASHDR